MKQVTFLDYLCNVHINHTYANGRQVIELEIAETGEPMCKATVNMPEIHLEKDEVIIKNYSENEGIFEILIQAGIIADTGKKANNGHVECPIAKLL
jgi:hypothetical protein